MLKMLLLSIAIEGTQPLCYCKNLVLKDCKMIKTDLSFENSEVNASIIGHIESIKNPLSGCIIADTIGDTIRDDQIYGCKAEIMLRKK